MTRPLPLSSDCCSLGLANIFIPPGPEGSSPLPALLPLALGVLPPAALSFRCARSADCPSTSSSSGAATCLISNLGKGLVRRASCSRGLPPGESTLAEPGREDGPAVPAAAAAKLVPVRMGEPGGDRDARP